MKPTEFCSAVIKSRHQHFACMAKSKAVHQGRGFCAKHAPAFKPFFVYRLARDEKTIDKVLVYQAPGDVNSYLVISPGDRTHGSRLWAHGWHRTAPAAARAKFEDAENDVKRARLRLAEEIATLRRVRRLAE